MRIDGITVSVDYADWFAQALPVWLHTLDSLTVVTAPHDIETKNLCADLGVRLVITDAMYAKRADFNKGAALNAGLAEMPKDEWLLSFDADIMPPKDWRIQAEEYGLEPGYFYGAPRVTVGGTLIGDNVIGNGYFQLWHSRDMQWQRKPRFYPAASHAAIYDWELRKRWPPRLTHQLPFTLTHLADQSYWTGRKPRR